MTDQRKNDTPLPATPRKRVPGARNLVTTGAGVRDAVAACAGRALTTFALAQIAVLQADANNREELPRLDNESDSAPAKPWQTFDNLISDDPEKATTAPVTIATEVKMGCAVLLVAVADLANHRKKLPPADPLGPLGQAAWREANVVRLMTAATARMRHLLRRDPLCRDLDYPMVFRQKFEAIVASKAYVDPGADQVARLFVDFLKALAWYAGVHAYEGEHLTLNAVTFYSFLASLAAVVPEEDEPVVRDVLSLVQDQVGQWSAARAQAAAAKKRPAPKRAPARAAAKPKAPPKRDPARPEAAQAAETPPPASKAGFTPAPMAGAPLDAGEDPELDEEEADEDEAVETAGGAPAGVAVAPDLDYDALELELDAY